jgi:hypothetical protein
VLTGVLLHVIESPVPIDAGNYFAVFQRFRQDVKKLVVFESYIAYRLGIEAAEVVRLSAGCCIKACPIQNNGVSIPNRELPEDGS